ncbi:YHS domain-containing (seleno)protein [Sinorhizobium sp. 8-89]|uniref:YHS domain-containing (seleno)protein n=1 Tax=Sinorhizobium sp. 7-81 TaxID=3049087 RepID=UPI0024C2DE05|nr:YHS domain-containing (seleno)protein [Sinorhizobium sp. 7-81]MDK1388676.1 YHS domain-containing (seleno)protein [Sinorhizobium sp. 7-81]
MTNYQGKCGMRIALALGAATILFSSGGVASAENLVNTGYFGDVAIKGYDPVAYFTENKAVEGSPQYSHRWLGATWHFASAEHRDLFMREPSKYAPQYGGYCADGVSFGTVTTNIDPKAWRIIDGKLYISYDPGAADGFEKNPSKVVDSQKHWSEVQQTLVSEKLQTNWQASAK